MANRPRLSDRSEAGRRLAEAVAQLDLVSPVVLGLPRGGLPVAAEVARALDAPLDVILVRKLGVPAQPELAMGAIGEHGARVVNDDVIVAARVTEEQLAAVERRERAVLIERAQELRSGLESRTISGRDAVLVDDGIATGATVRAAIDVARELGARRVVVAAPVAPADTVAAIAELADDVVCLMSPEPFGAVGAWYHDFRPTSDDEVVSLLGQGSGGRGPGAAS